MWWNPRMLAFGGYSSGIYRFFLLCHLITVIVGFGAVVLNGIYANEAKKRPGPPGRAVTEANFLVSGIGEYFIYAVPVFGILTVVASDKVWKFSQTWVWLAMLIYIIAIGLSHSIMIPGVKKIIGLQKEMEQGPPPAGGAPPQVAELQATGQRLAATGAALNLMLVVVLILMVWKPGA
jgi:uncharacterized membrane protein